MHGRIFVIDTKEDMQNRGYFYEAPWECYEMVHFIPGCDYVVREGENRFKDNCMWFAEEYCLKFEEDIWLEQVETNGEESQVAVVKVAPLTEALKKEKLRRLERIKEELEKPDPDMWRIQYEAWTDSGFWFVIPEYRFGPEMELLQWLKKESPEEIFITEVFDYHI